MLISDLLHLSTRMFRSRPSRTWLTVLGISVGIGAVLFLVSFGYGLQNIILKKIVYSQALLSLSVTPNTELVTLNKANLDELAALPKVIAVEAEATLPAQLRLDGVNGSIDLHAANAPFFEYAGIIASAGSLYAPNDRNEIVVSQAVARLFGIEDPNQILKKTVTIKIQVASKDEAGNVFQSQDLSGEYEIVGVIDDPQDSYAYIPLKEVSEQINVDHFNQARVAVANAKDLPAVKDVVVTKGFQVQSLQETIDQANKIFQVLQIILGLFGAVALIVSAIGMFNTMTVTLLERTNEIGTMRALGASTANIRLLFITESVILGFLGGVVGLLIGFVGGQIFNAAINSLATRFGGTPAQLFVYPGWFILLVIAISIVIGLISGVFPAHRAATMDPLDALRYK